MSNRAIPEGFRTVPPHLVVKGAAQAIEFYEQAFGAEESIGTHVEDVAPEDMQKRAAAAFGGQS